MPAYNRPTAPIGSNFTCIRLFDAANIKEIVLNTSTLIGTPLTITDTNLVYSFMQLAGTGSYKMNELSDEQGSSFVHELSFSFSATSNSILGFNFLIRNKYFVAVIYDGSSQFMMIGTAKQPLKVTVELDADMGTYNYTINGVTPLPPQFITGIFNPQVYVGGVGSV
jgi:hypothetical protein